MIITNLGLANVGDGGCRILVPAGPQPDHRRQRRRKTTALDALAICLEAVTRKINGVRGSSGRRDNFTAEDINVLAGALDVRLRFTLDGEQYGYTYHQRRASVVNRPGESSTLREQTYDASLSSEFTGATPPAAHGMRPRPFGILFSTRRAVPDDRAPSRAAAAGGQRAALADAFGHRDSGFLSSRHGCVPAQHWPLRSRLRLGLSPRSSGLLSASCRGTQTFA